MPGWLFILLNILAFIIPVGIFFVWKRFQKDYRFKTLLRYGVRAIILLVTSIIVGWRDYVSWYAVGGFTIVMFLHNILFKGEAKSDYYKW